MLVEICCDTLEKAEAAAKAGADRIELCSDLSCGGLTPPHEVIERVTGLDVPVNVLIRPREGDFVYSGREADSMLFNIAYCGNSGVRGVVIGALTHQGKIDMPLCKDLVDIARSYSLSVTFHRAIDCAADVLGALEDVLTLGVDRILTSGGAPSAFEGRNTIKEMVKIAGDRAIILAGAGITLDNAKEIIDYTGVKEIHGSRLELSGLTAL